MEYNIMWSKFKFMKIIVRIFLHCLSSLHLAVVWRRACAVEWHVDGPAEGWRVRFVVCAAASSAVKFVLDIAFVEYLCVGYAISVPIVVWPFRHCYAARQGHRGPSLHWVRRPTDCDFRRRLSSQQRHFYTFWRCGKTIWILGICGNLSANFLMAVRRHFFVSSNVRHRYDVEHFVVKYKI